MHGFDANPVVSAHTPFVFYLQGRENGRREKEGIVNTKDTKRILLEPAMSYARQEESRRGEENETEQKTHTGEGGGSGRK